jgi:hypothetical protein
MGSRRAPDRPQRDLPGRDGTVIAQRRLTGWAHAIGGAVPI